MKHTTLFCLALCAAVTLLSSCKKDDSSQVPTSFPRKMLIEQFTAQNNPYCPNETQRIDKALQERKSQTVRLSYHIGDNSDDFTYYTNYQLADALQVTETPTTLCNRTILDRNSQEPLPAATTTSVSVHISTTYDDATRRAVITISGKNIGEKRELTLVAILKESGLHAAQQDASNTWNGWSDYVHNNVARTFLNTYKGQVLEFNGINYEVTLDYELYKTYNADNCSVVAFLIDNLTGEVVNAEETPLVSGTKGGADFVSEGITAVPVPETYPETMPLPSSQSNIQYLTAQYNLSNYTIHGNSMVEIMLLSANLYDINGWKYLPTAILYVVTDGDGSTLPIGTFDFSTTGEVNTALAGQKIEEEFNYYGSEFFLAKYTDLLDGYIRGYEWLLTSGTLTITENSITYEATTLSGNKIRGFFSGTISHYTGEDLPRRR